MYCLFCTTSVLCRPNFLSIIRTFCLENSIIQNAIKEIVQNHVILSTQGLCYARKLSFQKTVRVCHFIIRIFTIAFELKTSNLSFKVVALNNQPCQSPKIVMTIITCTAMHQWLLWFIWSWPRGLVACLFTIHFLLLALAELVINCFTVWNTPTDIMEQRYGMKCFGHM